MQYVGTVDSAIAPIYSQAPPKDKKNRRPTSCYTSLPGIVQRRYRAVWISIRLCGPRSGYVFGLELPECEREFLSFADIVFLVLLTVRCSRGHASRSMTYDDADDSLMLQRQMLVAGMTRRRIRSILQRNASAAGRFLPGLLKRSHIYKRVTASPEV